MTTRATSRRPRPAAAAAAAAGAIQVEQYLAAQPAPQRATLTATRAALRKLLPRATEAIRYGMPVLLVDGRPVAGYAGFAAHCGYYPMSGTVLARAGAAVAAYVPSKGGLKFAIDRGLPASLLRKLVALRLAELASAGVGPRRAARTRTASAKPTRRRA